MKRITITACAALAATMLILAPVRVPAQTAVTDGPVVLELFTSQGCSSCPPADALLGGLANDASVLPLSFHIDYWDSLGWKDPYSLPASTKRQWVYARALGDKSVFTPQLIVNGDASVVGSRGWQVNGAIATAARESRPIRLKLSPDANGFKLAVDSAAAPQNITAELWEVRFVTRARTSVSRGENGGRTLESINNVTGIRLLGTWKRGNDGYNVAALGGPDDGIAVIAQVPGQGRILGAAAYIKH